MSINEKCLTFDTSEHFWHLHIEAELEAYLTLSGSSETTDLNDLT